MIPQLDTNLFLQLTHLIPLSKSICSSNSNICELIQKKILKLNLVQKENLVNDLLPLLQDWPTQINQRYENNTLINIYSKILSKLAFVNDEGPRGAYYSASDRLINKNVFYKFVSELTARDGAAKVH